MTDAYAGLLRIIQECLIYFASCGVQHACMARGALRELVFLVICVWSR